MLIIIILLYIFFCKKARSTCWFLDIFLRMWLKLLLLCKYLIICAGILTISSFLSFIDLILGLLLILFCYWGQRRVNRFKSSYLFYGLIQFRHLIFLFFFDSLFLASWKCTLAVAKVIFPFINPTFKCFFLRNSIFLRTEILQVIVLLWWQKSRSSLVHFWLLKGFVR